MSGRERGSILVHVLITSVLMAVVAAGLMSVMLLQYNATQREESGAMAKKLDEEILHSLISNWNNSSGGFNQRCTSFNAYTNGTTVAYTCVGAAGSCSCSCTSAGLPTVSASVAGNGNCQIQITSADLK